MAKYWTVPWPGDPTRVLRVLRNEDATDRDLTAEEHFALDATVEITRLNARIAGLAAALVLVRDGKTSEGYHVGYGAMGQIARDALAADSARLGADSTEGAESGESGHE